MRVAEGACCPQAEAHIQSEDIELHQDLPKIVHSRLEQFPASILQRSAAKTGYVYKQGKDFRGAFKKRWFVLWRHPAAAPGTAAHTYALLWYHLHHIIIMIRALD